MRQRRAVIQALADEYHAQNTDYDRDLFLQEVIHYIGPMQQPEVGLFFGVCKQRIEQIESQAKAKIQRTINRDPYLRQLVADHLAESGGRIDPRFLAELFFG